MQYSAFADLTAQPFLAASLSAPADLDESSKSILARDVVTYRRTIGVVSERKKSTPVRGTHCSDSLFVTLSVISERKEFYSDQSNAGCDLLRSTDHVVLGPMRREKQTSADLGLGAHNNVPRRSSWLRQVAPVPV